MIKIDHLSWRTEPAVTAWWQQWLEDARAATADAIKAFENKGQITEADLNSEIWGDLKQKLLEHCVNWKCAYCEISLKQARQSGHQEHFRPKLKVNYRKPGKKSAVNASATNALGAIIEHPGYFWLAYSPKNLLPSCEKCNTGRGKRNQFPLADEQRYVMLRQLTPAQVATLKDSATAVPSIKWPGYYYLDAEDLDQLEPRTLLHPYFDDPRDHLVFGHAGIEAARHDAGTGQPSAKGLATIDVLNLSDPGLREARAFHQRMAATRFSAAWNDAMLQGLQPDECKRRGWQAVEDVRSGKAQYSAAAYDALVAHFGQPV